MNIFKNYTPQRSFLPAFPKPLPRLCGWWAVPSEITDSEIQGSLSYFKSQGIECVNYMADLPKYENAANIAKELGIQIYAWLPAMLGLGFNKLWLYENHPEAYVVTKSGIHAYDHAIYGVSHYKFLCPNNPTVRNYLKQMYHNASLIKNLDGINLDYIRYIEQNLRTYDPNGDTCYCDYCVSSFKNKTGMNISEVSDPNSIKEWAEYRVNVITSLVNEIAEIVHKNGKRISADVYPGPWQSTRQVRQKWDDWDLDMVFPMIYTEVFGREVNWIGGQTGEGVAKLKENNRTTVLYTGLQAEAMSEQDFRTGVQLALKNGAYGISVFRLNTMNEEKFEILRNELRNSLGNNTEGGTRILGQ